MDELIDIRELRGRLGWNQDQLGAHCGVDRSTVSKWERDPPRRGPALVLLRQLQDRFDRPRPEAVE